MFCVVKLSKVVAVVAASALHRRIAFARSARAGGSSISLRDAEDIYYAAALAEHQPAK
jgi:hypothetical protein